MRMPMPPIDLRIDNQIPLGKGLGSSAAALTAGVVIADRLLDLRWKPLRILDEAARLEGHPDNVAACVLGSIVASAIDSGGVARTVRLNMPAHFGVGVVVPDFMLPTVAGALGAAGLLSARGCHFQRAAGGLAGRRAGHRHHQRLSRGARGQAFTSHIAPPLVPGLDDILKLRAPGLLGCALSGAGPSILVFFERGYEQVCDLVRQVFALHGHASEVLLRPSPNAAFNCRKEVEP